MALYDYDPRESSPNIDVEVLPRAVSLQAQSLVPGTVRRGRHQSGDWC